MTSFLTCIGDELFFTDSEHDVAGPNCSCLNVVNNALADTGARLGFWRLGGVASPTLYARKSDLSGRTPPIVIPQFCPFCGARYGGVVEKTSGQDTELADRVTRAEARIATLERNILVALKQAAA
jgi:hypothetical protein